MVVFRNFINIFYIPDLCKKILFTLGVLIIYRVGSHVPVIGVNTEALTHLMQQAKSLGGLFAYLDMFSGGKLRECTLFALGIMPYISASIVMQMLSMTVPSLEMLVKEGEYGRKVINQYTRYLALLVAVIQSSGYVFLLERNALVVAPGLGFRFLFILSLTVGSFFVMWLGEQISTFGLGNGSSVIIFAGIVAHFPDNVLRTLYRVQEGIMDPVVAVGILGIFIAIAACIVFLEKGERKIPIQYARRVIGNKVYGGQSSYIPFKINVSGVMPVIFAGAVLNIPVFISSMLAQKFAFFKWVLAGFHPMGPAYNGMLFCLIILFSFFYTAFVFNPEELAENIKKSGGFVPGIRPGKRTAEFFNYILMRLGLAGAIYLGVLALLPSILALFVDMPFYLSGTGLLIVVGVALELFSQIETFLVEHRYQGFLDSGRFKYRGRR